MPLVLRKRATNLSEQMDEADCDHEMLKNTYKQFRRMNPLISRWKLIYARFIKPELDANKINTMLDIGFGGGDILFSISKWAKKDGFKLKITGIDIAERALKYVHTLPNDPDIDFRLASLKSVRAANEKYDFVISNHLLHHLDTQYLSIMLGDLSEIAKKRVIFNDIERADFAYLGFLLFIGPFLRNSYARPDGLISIKRSYTKRELEKTVPPKWRIIKVFPFRLVLISD
ncbi:MAG: methyltransferase domain-containing protein [Balneolales bacterium]